MGPWYLSRDWSWLVTLIDDVARGEERIDLFSLKCTNLSAENIYKLSCESSS